jgi:uroporphyrinogen-III decarboxylase
VGTFDDFSTYLISPAMFRTYVLPCLKEYNEIYHRAGQVHTVHSCGHIRHFLPMCLEVGYDAHDYVTQPPTGDTTLAEARAAWGDRITIMAAVDPVMIERDPAPEVAARVSQMLAEMGTTRSFVLMTSSKPTVPEENLRAIAAVMAEARGQGC